MLTEALEVLTEAIADLTEGCQSDWLATGDQVRREQLWIKTRVLADVRHELTERARRAVT